MENLKLLRANVNLTQRELAEQLGLAKATYARYEVNETEPNIATLIKLADYFGCSVDYLIGHQTINTLQLDSLTEAQKQIIQRVHSLTEEQSFLVLGYLARIQEQPIGNIIDQIKNLK